MESGSGERLVNRGENENSHKEKDKVKLEGESWNEAEASKEKHKENELKSRQRNENADKNNNNKTCGNQTISIIWIRIRSWLINTLPQHSLLDEEEFEANEALAILTYYRSQKIFRIILGILTFLGLVIIGIISMILVQWLEGFQLHPGRAELSDYNVHLVCGGLSLIIMPAYGMLMFRIFPTTDYAKLVKIHMIVLLASSLLTIFGVKVAYDSHHVYGPIHLYSLHGWLGISISTLLFFLIISGNWMYFSTREFPRLKVLHRACGMVLFIFSVGASISGLLSRSIHLLRRSTGDKKLPTRVAVLNTLGLLITIFGVLTRYLLVEFKFRRRPVPGHAMDDEGTNFNTMDDTEAQAETTTTTAKNNFHRLGLSNININISEENESVSSITSYQEHQTTKVEKVGQLELPYWDRQRNLYTSGGPRSILSEILPAQGSSRSERRNTKDN